MTMRTWAAAPVAIVFLLGVAIHAAAAPPIQAKQSVVVQPKLHRIPVAESVDEPIDGPVVELAQADGDLLPMPAPVAAPQLQPAPAERGQPAGEPLPMGEIVPAPEMGGAISNVFVDSDLREALQDIALQAQVTIVAGPEVNGLITAELKDATLEEALEVVLAGTGYLVERTPRYFLVYSPEASNPALREISRTRREKLEYLKAEQAMKLIPPYYRDFASAEEGGNVIAISAPPQIIEEIRRVIAEIDQPQRHVLLQSRVVVLNESDLLNVGTQWGFPRLHMGGMVDDTLSGFGMRLGYTLDRQFTNELLVALNLLQRNERAEILSEPVVMAQDGQSSKISVTRQEYFRIIAQGYYVHTNIEEIETGTILEITPQIGESGEITLHLDIEVSDVTARGEDNLPVVDRRKAHNVIRLKDGGTAAIAGLMASADQHGNQHVPWFGRIPLLGKAFHSVSSGNSRKQVAVFITATIVEDPNGVEMLGPPGMVPGSPFHLSNTPVQIDEEEFRTALKESLARSPRDDQGKTRKQ